MHKRIQGRRPLALAWQELRTSVVYQDVDGAKVVHGGLDAERREVVGGHVARQCGSLAPVAPDLLGHLRRAAHSAARTVGMPVSSVHRSLITPTYLHGKLRLQGIMQADIQAENPRANTTPAGPGRASWGLQRPTGALRVTAVGVRQELAARL